MFFQEILKIFGMHAFYTPLPYSKQKLYTNEAGGRMNVNGTVQKERVNDREPIRDMQGKDLR